MEGLQTLFGYDDGFYNNKIYLGKGRKFIAPTRAKIGDANVASMQDTEIDIATYATKETRFANMGNVKVSVGADLREQDTTDFPQYPISPINRVIVHHTLKSLGVKPTETIGVCTGLPVKDYYLNGLQSVNDEFIQKKMDNLSVPVLDESGQPIVVIGDQEVVPEAFAAHYDFIMEEDIKTGKVTPLRERMAMSNVYVDIGGRTTDFALIEDNVINKKVSGSISVGMINFRDGVIQHIYDSFGMDENDLSPKQIDKMFETKTVKIDGETHDISEIIASKELEVATVITNTILKRLKGARGVDNILFVGGGSMALKTYIQSLYPDAIFPEDGIFANARGMYKYLVATQMKKQANK